MSDDIPEGYYYEEPPSMFPRHVGRIFQKKLVGADGEPEFWCAIRVEPHHVNAWGLAHGGLIAMMGEVATSAASWDPNGPPVVAIELNTHFIRAPKLGQLLEVRSRATRRTRRLIFAEAHAYADGVLMFTSTGINTVVGG